MGVEARTVRPHPGAPKRKLRNYLLDRRFQLKYTSMVVAVTLFVASILGALAYHESKGQTAALQIQLTMQPDLDPRVSAGLEAFGRDRDRQILLGILLGIAVLTIALGLTGIMITHKMVGPAYKMRMLFGTLAKGELRVAGGLRRGDELQDVFVAFNEMVLRLRERREHDLGQLEQAIARVRAGGASEEVVRLLSDVRDRLSAELAQNASS
jgi:methyl-accepting chemotaxis protein